MRLKTYRLPFQPAHITALGEVVEEGEQDIKVSLASSKHPSATLFDAEGQALACIGLIPFWPGVVMTWAVVSTKLAGSPYKRAVLDDIIKWHHDMSKVFGVRRFQSAVTTGWRPGEALVHLLGYRKECEMECYGPNGELTSSYAWLTKEK